MQKKNNNNYYYNDKNMSSYKLYSNRDILSCIVFKQVYGNFDHA